LLFSAAAMIHVSNADLKVAISAAVVCQNKEHEMKVVRHFNARLFALSDGN
jgi:hypothetical protein